MDKQHENPFRIPNNLDARILELKQEEYQRRDTERRRQRSVDIKKERICSRNSKEVATEEVDKKPASVVGARSNVCNKPITIHSYEESGIPSNSRVVEKNSSSAELFEKRREMLLLNMTIYTQKEEIKKIQDEWKRRADEIKANEARLEESIMNFDSFLEDNDNKAQEAERQVEKESKIRHQKIQEIKRLEQQIMSIRSDIVKNTDALDECSKCKDFLDSLTPSSWFVGFTEKKRKRQRARRRARIEKRKEEFLREQESLRSKVNAKVEKERRPLGKGRRQKKVADDDIETQLQEIPTPLFDDEPLESSGDECPMWFELPEQLVEKFSALENEILFLLKQAHELESSLHHLKLQFSSLKLEEDKEYNKFVTVSRHQIACLEVERCADVKEPVCTTTCSDGGSSANLLSLLHMKAIELYEKCGLSDNGCNPTFYFILSGIEATAESILLKMNQIPPSYLKTAMKKKKCNRRMEKRARQHVENERNAEERRKQVMDRVMMAPKKRVGKPSMCNHLYHSVVIFHGHTHVPTNSCFFYGMYSLQP